MKIATALTQDRLREVISYDKNTGVFIWKINHKKVSSGDKAGWVDCGYRRVEIDGKTYRLHRLVFLYEYGYLPKKQIDHINHNTLDNRLCNLRDVSQSINLKNKKQYKNNTSNETGVVWHKIHKKWNVSINVNKKRKFIGSYCNKSDAIAASKKARKQYGFHKNHGELIC